MSLAFDDVEITVTLRRQRTGAGWESVRLEQVEE